MSDDDDAAKRREKLQELRDKRKEGAEQTAVDSAADENAPRAKVMKALAKRRQQQDSEDASEGGPRFKKGLMQKIQAKRGAGGGEGDQSRVEQLETRLARLEKALENAREELELVKSGEPGAASAGPAVRKKFSAKKKAFVKKMLAKKMAAKKKAGMAHD